MRQQYIKDTADGRHVINADGSDRMDRVLRNFGYMPEFEIEAERRKAERNARLNELKAKTSARGEVIDQADPVVGPVVVGRLL